MKLQNLAVIFVIIILPISLVLTSYIHSRIDTLELQLSYDTKLYNATYDAIKAFQINTIGSSTSDLADSKMRDLQASVNAFFTSVQSNFSMNGYNKETLQNHVPALVYTLYDGYYIYSPFTNTLDEKTQQALNVTGKNTNDVRVYDFKPYVYYSCRYIRNNIDVVITYSLDSYITIVGTISDEYVNKSGYLLSSVEYDDNKKVKYRGQEILESGYETLRENICVDGEIKTYPYQKVNGVKYYKDESNGEVFSVSNGEKKVQIGSKLDVIKNDNAVLYYKQAAELKEFIKDKGLIDLEAGDAVDENGKKNTNFVGTYRIFGELNNDYGDDKKIIQIEDENSDFNNHRLDVIKYSIEKNLSVAISNFNDNSTSTSDFAMPKLKDEEWSRLTRNIGMISFLQGLSIGGKIYNGYSIITNNKNEEFVADESIYIVTNDGTYHNVADSDLEGNVLSGGVGYFNVDFERKSGQTTTGTKYYYPREEMGCYYSTVSQSNIKSGSIYDILKSNAELAKIYYTALARERYGMYRPQNEYENMLQ